MLLYSTNLVGLSAIAHWCYCGENDECPSRCPTQSSSVCCRVCPVGYCLCLCLAEVAGFFQVGCRGGMSKMNKAKTFRKQVHYDYKNRLEVRCESLVGCCWPY